MGGGEGGCCTKWLCVGRVGELNKPPPSTARIGTVLTAHGFSLDYISHKNRLCMLQCCFTGICEDANISVLKI